MGWDWISECTFANKNTCAQSAQCALHTLDLSLGGGDVPLIWRVLVRIQQPAIFFILGHWKTDKAGNNLKIGLKMGKGLK